MSLAQIQKLQAARPFQEFALELDNGRIVQIYEWTKVASKHGSRLDQYFVGILRSDGAFEVIDGQHIVSVSVGVHPKVKEDMQRRMERAKKIVGE
jgi:hypothetical protein